MVIFRKNNLFPLLRVALPSHALVGLTWQVILITNLYLKYDVVTETEIKIPYNVHPVSFIYCPYLPFILDIHKLKQLIRNRSITYTIPEERDVMSVEDLITFLTTQDFFDLTPNDVNITKCRYRIPRSYLMDDRECGIIFHVTRYLRSQYMCYRFKLVTDVFHVEADGGGTKLYSFHQVKNTISHPGLLFEILLDGKKFQDASFFSASIYNNEQQPVGDSDFPVLVSNEENNGKSNTTSRARLVSLEDEDMDMDESDETEYHKPVDELERFKRENSLEKEESLNRKKKYKPRKDEYSFAFKTVHNTLLPSPFVTHCKTWAGTTLEYQLPNSDGLGKKYKVQFQSDAVSKCIWYRTVYVLDRVPLSSDTWEPMRPLKLVSLQDMDNVTFNDIYTKIKTECMEKFKYPDCDNREFVTKLLQRNFRSASASVDENQDGTLNFIISFRVYIPDGPTLVTVCSEKLVFTQFLVYLFNCFSTWFGISLFDLHSLFLPTTRLKGRQENE